MQKLYMGNQQKKKKVRSRSPSPSTSDSTHDSASLRRQRVKSKRSLILAEYDEFSSQLNIEETSLHNQSLASLGVTSETSAEKRRRLLFTKSAKEECLKVMSKNHFKEHCGDLSSLLDCHNLSYRQLSEKYTKGPEVLTRKRIYALIYLGLLINKDKIQLGDMLRFIREGCLSYHSIDHFFPEEYENRNLNIKTWNMRSLLLTHSGIRVAAAKIAKFIGVIKYIPRQNLIELCQRYCSELNLPDELWGFTLNLMSKVPPRMHFTKHSNEIPNYEGRVLSMIIFTVKLIFGLDDATEEYFSNYAESINASNSETMFIWRDWAHYIIYRKLVLMQHHFPTQHIYDDDNIQHCSEFVSFVTEKNLKCSKETADSNRVAEVLKGLLEKLKDKQIDHKYELTFTATLKPFQDYIQILLNTNIPQENNYLIDVLESNFKQDSLRFLTNPYTYLEQLHRNKRIGFKHRGANKNLSLTKIQNTKRERENWRINAKRKHYVQIVRNPVVAKHNTKEVDNVLDTKIILKNFELYHMDSYKKIMSQMAKIHNRNKQNLESDIGTQRNECENQTHTNIHKDAIPFVSENITSLLNQSQGTITDNIYIHYNPHDRFWLRNQNVSEINKEDFLAFFKKFPESFKLIFNECARISEQDLKEYFDEYNNVEIYLCYATSFTNIDKLQEKHVDIELNKLIQRAVKKW